MTAQSTTGDYSAASTTGYYSAASTTGCYSAASTTGNRSAASTTGYYSAASTTGNRSAASTTGYYSAASTTGCYSAASTTGCYSAAFSAQWAAEADQATAVGRWVRLTDTSGAAVVLSPDPFTFDPYVVSRADGWSVGVWITMSDAGMVEEHPDVLALDLRGYILRWTEADGYTAGCREFATADWAIAHWSNTNHEAPDSAAILRAAVEAHAASQAVAS
jgi:hypothetical protein